MSVDKYPSIFSRHMEAIVYILLVEQDSKPGAISRDDAIFSGEQYFRRESLLQELKSPWELALTEPVSEVVEFRPYDWPQKYFLGKQRGGPTG